MFVQFIFTILKLYLFIHYFHIFISYQYIDFLFFILFSFKGFSQFELPKKTITIAPVSNPKGADSPTSSKSISYPSIFDKKDKLGESVSLLKKKPEEEKSIFEKEQFASPAKKYTDKMNKQVTDGKIYDYYKKDYVHII